VRVPHTQVSMAASSTGADNVAPHFQELQGRLLLLVKAPAPPGLGLYLDLLDIVTAEREWMARHPDPWANVLDEDRHLVRTATVALGVRIGRIVDEYPHAKPARRARLLDAADAVLGNYAQVVHRLAGSEGSMPVLPESLRH